MSDLNQKIEKLSSELENIKGNLNLKEKRTRLKELEGKTTDPNFWDDQERARGVMQEFGDLRNEMEEIDSLGEQINTLLELSKSEELTKEFEAEVRELSRRLDEFKLSSFLSDTYDRKNAIVSIHAGQGGTEAMDWASMLYRMYVRFCENRGWEAAVIDLSEGDEAGIKSVTFKVKGPYAFGYLKGEAGTHRLVRQSPFNADRLRQTSFALIEVLPELEEADNPDIEMKDDDLEWQFFRASGQGGQNVQKVSSAVRVIHKPTDISVTSQQERTQEQNRKIAMGLLRAKLWALEQKKKEEKIEEIKGEYRPASWGNQIRSYVLHPYKMVKDLRTEVETNDTDAVLDGQIDEFIKAEVQRL